MSKKIPLLALSFAVAVMSACGGDSKHNPTAPGVGGDDDGGNNGNGGGNASASFEATVTGNGSETLRGSAEFGAVTDDGAQAFTVVLQAQEGAIVFIRPNVAGTPQTGEYSFTDATGEEVPSGEFYAAAVEGSLDQPTAVLYSRSGTLRITSAADNRLEGEFEFDAVGTLPDDPDTVVEVSITGTFDAAPGSAANARITSRRVLTHRARQ